MHLRDLEKRFGILANKIHVRNSRQIDSIFKTNAILHNMIMRFDERDDLGVLDSDWISADVELDDVRIRRGAHSSTPSSSTAFSGEDWRTAEDPTSPEDPEEDTPDFHQRRVSSLSTSASSIRLVHFSG